MSHKRQKQGEGLALIQQQRGFGYRVVYMNSGDDDGCV
jgi:hypothetical protein